MVNIDVEMLETMKSIDKKLSYIVGDKVKKEKELVKEQVVLLSEREFEISEIAKILNLKPHQVSNNLYKAKKNGR